MPKCTFPRCGRNFVGLELHPLGVGLSSIFLEENDLRPILFRYASSGDFFIVGSVDVETL